MKKFISILYLFMNFTIVLGQNPDFDENYTSGYGYIPEPSPFMISGNWSILPNAPNSLSRSCCAYVEINGVPYLYQFGGGNSTSELRRVSRLNLSTNSWEYNYSTMPFQISAGTAIPFNGGTEILVFGGNSPTFGKTLKYNVGNNTWQTMSDMPTKITDALVVKHSESHIFIVGGGDGYYGASALKTNKVQVYNIASNTYSYSNDLPIPISMLGGGLYRDTIITAGGYTTNGVAIANCYKGVINPLTLSISWTQIQNYPAGPITRMASFVAVKGTGVGIMCTGGAVGGSVPTSLTHFWNFCTQNWQPGLPDNTQARSNYRASGKGYDLVYTVGGYTTNTNSNRTESLIYSHIDGPCQNMVGINGNNNIIPLNYELKQNYPNPFNPQTKISFSVPKSSYVKIYITNAAGMQVKIPVNSFYSTGNYSVTFEAQDLSSGIYFYTMESDGFKETRKMLLIK